MSVRRIHASGLEYLTLATELLQRARLASPDEGLWEAADLQWWWRTPRASDEVGQLFWVDGEKPIAGAILTDWGDRWGCDPIVVPGAGDDLPGMVWAAARDLIHNLGLSSVEVLVRDDDLSLRTLVTDAGFVPGGERSGITWMDADRRPSLRALADGFEVVDRLTDASRPDPMQRRSGTGVEARLRQCSLYDPELDIAVRSVNGRIAGYALFWFDPVTRVGLVEPVRVEDEYQRRGIARAMLSEGLHRLAARGAERFKVGYSTDEARALYVSAGFEPAAAMSSYRWHRSPARPAGLSA